MADFFILSEAPMRRMKLFFPSSHGIARVDDRPVISGIISVIRNWLRWRDAHALRQMRPHLHVRHLHRGRRHLLAMINESWAQLRSAVAYRATTRHRRAPRLSPKRNDPPMHPRIGR